MEVGKAAKHMGLSHPRDIRRAMLLDERSLAGARVAKRPKNFGFAYETLWFHGGWVSREEWFTTARGRDQALVILRRRHAPRGDIRAVSLIVRGGASEAAS